MARRQRQAKRLLEPGQAQHIGDAEHQGVEPQLLEQQHKVGASLRELLQEVQGTVALAQREAALNNEVVGRLESAAQSLARAEQRADVYLQGVSEVLAKAHGAFADNVERSLKAGNAQFQRELAEAVGYLKDAIEHLGDVLADGKR